jgi:preprotein translocase subunit SecE
MEKGAGVDPKRIVAIFFVFAAVCLGVFLEKVLGLVFSYTRWNDFPIFGDDWTLTTVVGYGIAAATAVVVWRTPRLHAVSLEVAGELKKVTWPSLRETRAATVAVVLFSFLAAALLGVFDFIWAKLSALVY